MHNRLHTSYQKHLPSPPAPQSSHNRSGSPTGAHDANHSQFAGFRDAKPASPTRHVAYGRMEKDIAARRAREGERASAIANAVRDHASARHTLKSSEKLGKQKLERALRAHFLDADIEGKG